MEDEKFECPDCGCTDLIIQEDTWICPICLQTGNIFEDFLA